MRISDWSSDVCSSDLIGPCDPTFALTTWLVGQRPQPTEGEDGDDQERVEQEQRPKNPAFILIEKCVRERTGNESLFEDESDPENGCGLPPKLGVPRTPQPLGQARCLRLRLGRTIRSLRRSEEHTSELHSLMRQS